MTPVQVAIAFTMGGIAAIAEFTGKIDLLTFI